MKIRWLNSIFFYIIPRLAAAFSLIVGYTTKLHIFAPSFFHGKKDFFEWENGVIFCIYHSRFFYLSYYGRGSKTAAMISNSKDGQIIANTIHQLRIKSIRGSSSKNGHEVMMDAVELLRNKYNVLITPDGPRGPKYQIKPGVIRAAQLSGSPILPVCFCSTKGIFFPSWDRFFLPLPFGKALLNIAEPIYVPATLTEDEFEKHRLELEKIMNELRIQTDDFCERNPEEEVKKMWKKIREGQTSMKSSKRKA